MNNKRLLHSSPGLIVFASLCLVIGIGTLLLLLPIAQQQPVSFLDTFFTATSATCVTGLFTVPLTHFSLFGHWIIMILMQIGGLGLITMTLMFLSLFVNFGLSTQLMAGHILDLESWKNIKHLLLFIVLFSLSVEFIGACIIAYLFMYYEPTGTAIFHALFHAIASFCNAGIELPSPYIPFYKVGPLLLTITMILSLMGGLGFITWHEVVGALKAWWYKQRFRFSLHSKIIFYGTTTLLLTSTLLILILEYHNAYKSMSVFGASFYALFQAITSKSIGFSIIPLAAFRIPTILVMMFLAFIGSSPASTGSGIKITTFTILLATVKTALSGKTSVDLRGRRIALDQVLKAVTICFLGISSIALTTFLLCVSQKETVFFNLFFEAWSALTNLGTSLNTTQSLSLFGKILVIICMTIGRVGSFTLILSIKMIRGKDTNEFIYPEERIML